MTYINKSEELLKLVAENPDLPVVPMLIQRYVAVMNIVIGLVNLDVAKLANMPYLTTDILQTEMTLRKDMQIIFVMIILI